MSGKIIARVRERQQQAYNNRMRQFADDLAYRRSIAAMAPRINYTIEGQSRIADNAAAQREALEKPWWRRMIW